jgi:glycosyltransferase involved in cell wall biosynthesis
VAEQELPLVSVVTSTWRRADVLMQRCIPSVMAQSYPNVEHIIVSDRPDDELLGKLRSFLDESDAPDNLELHSWKSTARLPGTRAGSPATAAWTWPAAN